MALLPLVSFPDNRNDIGRRQMREYAKGRIKGYSALAADDLYAQLLALKHAEAAGASEDADDLDLFDHLDDASAEAAAPEEAENGTPSADEMSDNNTHSDEVSSEAAASALCSFPPRPEVGRRAKPRRGRPRPADVLAQCPATGIVARTEQEVEDLFGYRTLTRKLKDGSTVKRRAAQSYSREARRQHARHIREADAAKKNDSE